MLLTIVFGIHYQILNAQIHQTISVGKQTLINQIRNTTTDENGNIYYVGVFKGALTVNGDTLLYGMGGNDYFLVKESPSGDILWAKNYGSEREESSGVSVLTIGSSVYMNFSISNPISIENFTINLLPNTTSTGCLLKLDSSGNTLWVKRFNTSFFRMYPYNDNLMMGSMLINPPAQIYMEGQSVYSPTAQSNTIYLTLTKDGAFIDCKGIAQNTTQASYLATMLLTDFTRNRFSFLIATSNTSIQSGNNKLVFNGTTITLPNSIAHLIIKTDSHFNFINNKFLSSTETAPFPGLSDENRMRFSSDSSQLYLPVSSGTFTIDGFNEDLSGRNALAIMDTNLITQKITTINQNPLQGGLYRVKTDNLIEYGNHFYYFATVTGNNQSPTIVDIPKQIFSIQLAKNYTENFDINEPSKVFLIKTDKSFNRKESVFLGSTASYELTNLQLYSIKITNGNIHFINSSDNTWNPWKIDTALHIKNGEMKMAADRGDHINRVHYFQNKSVFALGTASGLTSFDTSTANIITSNQRNDVFFALLDSNNQLIKYTRIFTSFSFSTIRAIKTKNDTVYAYLDYASPKNSPGNNYFSVENISRIVPDIYLRILLKIDKSGNVKVIDLQDTPVGPIFNFDVFDNGDLALLSANSAIALNINGQQFPSTFGYYIARMNGEGKITKAMKFLMGSGNGSVFPRDIIIEPDKQTFTQLLYVYYNLSVNQLQLTTVRNGNQYSIKSIPNPLPNSTTLPWYFVPYQVSFSENKFHAIAGPFSNSISGGIAKLGSKYALNMYNFNNTAPISFNQQLIAQSGSLRHTFLLSFDSTGNYNSHLTFKNTTNPISTEFIISRTKSIKDHLYVSGTQNNVLKFGALTIGHMGGQDGLILKLDSSLNLVQYYKTATIYSDKCTDIDFYSDSSFIIAFQSQGNPKVTVGLSQIANFSNFSFNPQDLDDAGYLNIFPASLLPNDYVYTIKNGSWHDASIWSNGKVPEQMDKVFIKHKIQVHQNAFCYTLYADPASDLKIDPTVELKITGLPPVN
jgi:hypothetical protein